MGLRDIEEMLEAAKAESLVYEREIRLLRQTLDYVQSLLEAASQPNPRIGDLDRRRAWGALMRRMGDRDWSQLLDELEQCVRTPKERAEDHFRAGYRASLERELPRITLDTTEIERLGGVVLTAEEAQFAAAALRTHAHDLEPMSRYRASDANILAERLEAAS